MIRNLVVVLLAGAMSGCVVHVSDDGVSSDWGDRGAGWQERQQRNRMEISMLPLGTPMAEVTDLLGDPDFTEAFSAADGDYRVYFYRTHHRHSDGETTRDETTPVVFLNGKVHGYGDDYYRRLMRN